MKASWKHLLFPLALFGAVFLGGVLAVSEYGLAFFNLLFGKPVYAIDIYCAPKPSFTADGVGSVSFSFDIKLVKERQPVEALLKGYTVREFTDHNIAVPFKLNILIYCLNSFKLFQGTLTFDDLNPRLITVFLHKLPAEAKMVYVDIGGSYTLKGEEICIGSYGGTFAVEG